MTAFFYNPNISLSSEYRLRLGELRVYAEKTGLPLVEGNYDRGRWASLARPFARLGERSERCWVCYRMRLEETFARARSDGFGAVAATLSISPHKNAERINAIGRELSARHGVEFLEADFKKNDGYKKSVEISRREGFYRQQYCGCIYSKMEREGNPRWLDRLEGPRSLNKKLAGTG